MPINDEIRVSEMMVIGPNGEQLGVKKRSDALTLASYAGLDLVLMNSTPGHAVGKIMDYNRYRYERQKKQKEALKKQFPELYYCILAVLDEDKISIPGDYFKTDSF